MSGNYDFNNEKLIANNILSVVCDGNRSAISVFFDSAGSALLSFSKDMGYLGWDFLNTADRASNLDDRVRMFEQMATFLKDQDLQEIITIVIKVFFKKTKKRGWSENIAKFAGTMAGKHVVNKAFLDEFTEVFVKRFVAQILVKVSFNFAVSIGSMSSRAIYVSRGLAERCPSVYQELRSNGGLDLFYFLVEDYCNPFLDAIVLSEKNPESFDRVIGLINEGMLQRQCSF
jgi:hypothetical protein